jgi:thiol-disulfide isomerase/thioredoxin
MQKSFFTVAAVLTVSVITFLVTYQIIEDNRPITGEGVLVVYHASWCGPCRMFDSTLKSSEVENALDSAGIRVRSIDVDQQRTGPWNYDGRGIPAYALVRGNRVVRVGHGYQSPAEFRAWLAGR